MSPASLRPESGWAKHRRKEKRTMESYKEDKRGGALATEYRSDATSNSSLGFLHQILAVLPDESRGGWEEEYAYSLGVQAYVWGFPWIYLSQLRWLWTTEGGRAIAK